MDKVERIRLDHKPHPLRVYRLGRLAKLIGVDPSTLWRWERDGVLPPRIQIGPGVKGWTEEMLKEVLDQRRREANGAG